jgi:basic amino acid/polyamine antiporter, APA family
MSENKTRLGYFSLTMIVIGLVIGMGIFRNAKDSAAASLTPNAFFLAWILGGVVALCGALTYAEIGARYPVTGGYYKIFATCYHPSVAFAVNCVILISNAASLDFVALVGSDYICEFLFGKDYSHTIKVLIAMSAVVLFYGINLMGIRMSSRTQNVLMLIKIGMVLLLISALLFPAHYAPQEPVRTGFSFMDYLKSFGIVMVAVSFTYGGYQQTINFGDEVQQPRKTIPRGITTGIFIILGLYLLANFTYYKIIGFEQLKTATNIGSAVVGKVYGAGMSNVFSVLLFLAVLAYVNVLLMSNPRVMYAMSKDGILPASFSKKDEKREVPTTSLTVYAAICILILCFANTIDTLLNLSILLDSVGMATSAATIFILRKRTKELDKQGIYKVRLYPLLPIIFILAYTFVGVNIFINNTSLALICLSVLVALFGVYFIIPKKQKTA